MKDEQFTSIICKKFCKFYKEGKEEIHCGGYDLLKNNLTLSELLVISNYVEKIKSQFISDKSLTEFICKKCEFLIDGCDFIEGLTAPPCGGYIFINMLMKYFEDTE